MTLKSDAKFKEKLTSGLKNDMRKHLNVSKFGLRCDPFIQSRKCMSLKFTEELWVMKMKNNAKFEEELTCHFNIDMRNLTNLDPSTRKSQKFAPEWALFDQSI